MTSAYRLGSNSNFNINISDFSGPAAALLELIQKKKMSIYDVSISTIIKEFIVYIKNNKNILIDEISGFIYMAAVLLEIKAKSLIPSKNLKENETQESVDLEVLRQREEQYRFFKEVSQFVEENIEKEMIYLVREAPLEEEFTGFLPELLKDINTDMLFKAASRLLITREEKITLKDIFKEKFKKTIFEEIDRIKKILGQKDDTTFKELTNQYLTLTDIVLCFLSILELYKNNFIDIEQFEIFGEIIIKRKAA